MRIAKRLVAALLVALLVFGLASSALASPGHGKGHNKGKFKDFDEAPWAQSYITEMFLKSIIKGYPDGTFQPNKPVTRVEAVIMTVRALGWEPQADLLGSQRSLEDVTLRNYDDDDDDEDSDDERSRNERDRKFRDEARALPWALGHLLLALEKGLVEPDELLPVRYPAKREFVAALLVRALDMKDEALAAKDRILPFKDAAAISPRYRGYVAVAVDLGLFTGYPEGTFRPQQAVKRAEMAALLSRLDENIGLPVSDRTGAVSGQITAVGTHSITVMGEGGRALTYQLAADVEIYLDRQPADLDDLKPGYAVRVLLDDAGRAALISARSTSVVQGTVTVITTGSTNTITVRNALGQTATYTLAANVAITYNGQPVTLADLQVGDKVSLTLTQGLVTAIAIDPRPQGVVGVVTARTTDQFGRPATITVQAAAGTATTYNVAADVQVTYNGQATTFASIAVGDRVELTLANQVVTGIVIQERYQSVQGTVTATATNAFGHPKTISIKLANGRISTYNVAVNVEVAFNNQPRTFADIQVGDVVALTISNNLVTKITIVQQVVTVEGVVAARATNNYGHPQSITIRAADGSATRYDVSAAVEVYYGSQAETFNSINIYDQVALSIKNNVVEKITIKVRAVTFTGQVVSVDAAARSLVVARAESGGTTTDVTVTLDQWAVIAQGGQARQLTDITPGASVEVTGWPGTSAFTAAAINIQ